MRVALVFVLAVARHAAALAFLAAAAAPASAAEPKPSSTAPEASSRRYVTASFVRMRERPSKDARVIDLLPWGTRVELVSTSPDGDYHLVQLQGSGRRGAVASAYLSATPPVRRGSLPWCAHMPLCMTGVPIDRVEQSERSWTSLEVAFGTWLAALGSSSPYRTLSSVDALNASPLFADFEAPPPRPRRPAMLFEHYGDSVPRFEDPPRDGEYLPPSDLVVGRVLQTGESWNVQLAHPPAGAVRLSPDRRSVAWEAPRKAILVSTCSPGFIDLDVTVSADIFGVRTLVTPRDVPAGTLACLEGKDVTYGRDLRTIARVVLDQGGGLTRLRQALAGTKAVPTDYGGRGDIFEIRFQREGRTNAVFRGIEEQACGSVDPSIQYRVGERWEQIAAETFGDSC